jgi:hypothetical protein
MSFRPRSQPALREVLYAAAVRPRLTGRYRPGAGVSGSHYRTFKIGKADAGGPRKRQCWVLLCARQARRRGRGKSVI